MSTARPLAGRLAMSAWSVKTQRAPSRHCRDARVYGDTTTAMHGNECTPFPAPVAGIYWYTQKDAACVTQICYH